MKNNKNFYRNLYCREKSTNQTGTIAGWDSPDIATRNIGGLKSRSFAEYETSTFFQKEVLMQKVECLDHQFFMNTSTSTYYPPRGACFR